MIQRINGQPFNPDHAIHQIDHSVQTFTVTIRSMSHISADSIKDQLQKKWEVTHCELKDETQFVR